MLTRSLVFRQLVRFCSKGETKPVEKVNPEFLAQAQKKQSLQIPVHLRPYNKEKYEVPMKKIKKNSGYAMVQIEPFPRARIMKICYNILADIKKGLPEDYFFRIYTEEKIKFIMEIVDREEDVQVLESLLGKLPIEIFIRTLADQLEVINVHRTMKPWEDPKMNQEQIKEAFLDNQAHLKNEKYPQYKKSDRGKGAML